MKKMIALLFVGFIFSIAACGGGSGNGAASSSSTGTTTSTKPAFYTGGQAILEGEYYVSSTADSATVPAAAWSHTYGSYTPTGTAVNEISVVVSASTAGNGLAFTLVSPDYPSGVSGSKSVLIGFGTQPIHKLFVLSGGGPTIAWGIQCNTDTNCITGPITYGTVPTGVDVTELVNGGSATALTIGAVFVETTSGTGVVDKVGWSIFSRNY